MPIKLIKDIITEGTKYQAQGRIGQLVAQLKKIASTDEKPLAENQAYEALKDLCNHFVIDDAIKACNDNYMHHSNLTVRMEAISIKDKMEKLNTILRSPEKYFEMLVNDGSDQFHALNVPLQKVLFTTEPEIKISPEFKQKNINNLTDLSLHVVKTFNSIKEMMQLATNLLSNPEFKKDESIKYLEGRITRRLKEMPIAEHLLVIRLGMNFLEKDSVSNLNETVLKAADEWRAIYFEMKHLQAPYLEKAKAEGQTLTHLEKCCMENYGFVADRIDKAIKTLDEAFKACQEQNRISDVDYSTLSTSIYSTTRTQLVTMGPDHKPMMLRK